MPNPTAPSEYPENQQIKYKNLKEYSKFGKLGLSVASGFAPESLGRPSVTSIECVASLRQEEAFLHSLAAFSPPPSFP